MSLPWAACGRCRRSPSPSAATSTQALTHGWRATSEGSPGSAVNRSIVSGVPSSVTASTSRTSGDRRR